MPADRKNSENSARNLKKSSPRLKAKIVSDSGASAGVRGDANPVAKKNHPIPPDSSFKNLAAYVKRLEKENSILAKELIQKKERRLRLPILNPEETRMAVARLNLRITETESLMAHQKKGLTDVRGIISTQENRMKEIADKISNLQKDVSKKAIQPQEAKLQLEGLLAELQKLRMRREEALAGLAV